MSNVKIILVGDSAEGLKQAPLGMWYAKKMRADGGRHGLVRSFVPAEGVLFRVLLDDYTGDKCYIEAAVGCPLIQYSGYLDAYSGVYDMDTAGGRAAAARRDAAEDTVERLVNNVDVHIPMMSGIRKVPAYDQSKDPLPTLPPGSVLSSDNYPIVSVPCDAHDADFRDLFTRYKPTRFTGLMRKVMQCTFGSGAWYGISYKGTSDPDGSGLPPYPQIKLRVNFKFMDCHGVVLAPGTDGSKGSHYHLIHIDAGNVSYVPADFCVHKVKVDGVDAFAPVLKAVHSTKAIQIGTLPSLEGSSCSPVVGWAFSYKEPKASVVIYGCDATGGYTTVKQVDISIAFAGVTPTSISVHQGKAEIFWNHNRTDKDGMFPIGVFNPPSQSGSANTTMDIRGFPAQYLESYTATNIPVHIYYTPSKSQPEVVTYSFNRTPATSSSTPWGSRSISYMANGMGTRSDSGGLQWGFTLNGASLPPVNGTLAVSVTKYAERGLVGGTEGYSGGWYVGGMYILVYTSYSYDIRFTNLAFTVAGVTTPYGTNFGTLMPTITYNATRPHAYCYVDSAVQYISGGSVALVSTCTLPIDDVESAVIRSSRSVSAITDTSTVTPVFGRVSAGVPFTQSHPPSNDDALAAVNALQAGFYRRNGFDGGVEIVSSTELSATPGNSDDGYYDVNGSGETFWGSVGTLYALPGYTTDSSHGGLYEITVTVYGGHEPVLLDSDKWATILTQVYDEYDRFAVRHSSSAFAPKKYYSYDKALNHQVVVMGTEEYNQTNAVTGWIGVV